MPEASIEIDDVQGMVLGGFNTDFQTFAALSLEQLDRLAVALSWIASLSQEITSAAAVAETRAQMKSGDAAPGYWAGVAVGKRVVDGLGDLLIRDAAFNGGIVARAPSILGDHTEPADWRVGKTAEPVDVLLVVGSNDPVAADRAMDKLLNGAAAHGLRVSYREQGIRLSGEREHFGFRDGISQPRIVGFDPDGTIEAGNFIFGYPAKPDASPVLPVLDPRNLAPNGSLLVFRRLRQDVAAFQAFCVSEAKRASKEWPELTPEHLAALIVGRWPSGAPVKTGVSADPGGDPPSDDFNFHDDPEGSNCPLAAHIRKVNPRAGKRDEVDVPRILRRGIPFGISDHDRGLLFIAFQSAIPDQFEKLTRKWMNGGISPNPGHDLLVGRSLSERTMMIAGPGGTVVIKSAGTPWIIPTGGAYLFAPGKRALSRFSERAIKSVFFSVRRLATSGFDQTIDKITRSFQRD